MKVTVTENDLKKICTILGTIFAIASIGKIILGLYLTDGDSVFWGIGFGMYSWILFSGTYWFNKIGKGEA